MFGRLLDLWQKPSKIYDRKLFVLLGPNFDFSKNGGRPFVLVPDLSHELSPEDRWEADDYMEKAMQNDASHLSYGEIKHTQVKKTKT